MTVSDEALWRLAADGDLNAEETLAERYRRFVRAVAHPYFLVGGDGEDLVQEGMLGVLVAIRRFDPARNASFHTFAEMCIRSRIYTAIRASRREKNSPLIGYVPLESGQLDESAASGLQSDPEAILLARERLTEVLNSVKEGLSAMEQSVLLRYLEGDSYGEIAERLGCTAKSVDNAIQRIRRKLT